jgi:rhodanese-related sulfurtransferase
MLEFWVDPESPYYREKLNDESKQYLLFCASAWRSALATDRLTEMGMENVSHIEGGFSGWKEASGPIEKREKKG